MVVATVPQPYEAPLRPQLTGTTVAPTGGATDRRRLGGCHDPSPKNDGCGACSHSYSLHRPWANTAASRPSNAAATNPNHRDPGGPMTGAGRAVTGDGMVSAGFGSGRNGDCSSSSASAPISVSVIASLLRPHRNHLRHHGRWKIGPLSHCPLSRGQVMGQPVRAGVRRDRDGPAARYGSSPDSPLEGGGFELQVPRQIGNALRRRR